MRLYSKENINIQINKIAAITILVMFSVSLIGNLFLYHSGKIQQEERDREVLRTDSLLSIDLLLQKELDNLRHKESNDDK
jgi:hypothetical protein